jgi:hypothetical protein
MPGVDMLVHARRPTAFLCIALLAQNLVACHHITHEEPQTLIRPGGEGVPMEKVVGVTLKDGRDIRFDKNSRPVVRGDSLRAEFGNQPVTIPVSDVKQILVRSISTPRTTFLVVGLTAATLYVLMAIAVSQAVDQAFAGY